MGTVEQWNSRFYKFLLYGREMLLKGVISQEKKVGQVFHCSTVPMAVTVANHPFVCQ
jgi:hypothetical protein